MLCYPVYPLIALSLCKTFFLGPSVVHPLMHMIVFSPHTDSLCRIGRFCLHRRFTVCLMLFC
ncbi:hypothetical protein Hanom_Chr17g01527601 [Helianthus anomalus]